jgi:hypothetical protein
MHEPPKQVCSAPHTFPQAPQLLSSASTSMQLPLQLAWPAGHAQAPFTHSTPVAHFVAQVPQWSSSEVRSLHPAVSPFTAPHWVSPPVQTQVPLLLQQAPLVQLAAYGFEQTLPHFPQLFLSVCRFLQEPLEHSVRPALHSQSPPVQL